jgi:glutamine synthetase
MDDRLEEDHEYLTAGGVFTEDLIDTWISYKRENQIMAIQIRPHPYEFALYSDVQVG